MLVVNAGSSSLKLRLLDGHDVLERSADIPSGPGGVDPDELTALLRGWPAPDAVGHRIVHGGRSFTGPVEIDADVRRELGELAELAPLHQPQALAALDVYTHRLVGAVAAMAAALGGLDVLVFTGGVGEHSAGVRRRAAQRLGFLGVAIDDPRNDTVQGDGDIGAAAAPVRTLVIASREDLQIAREARRVLQS
ncbi:hypothetical protein ACVGOW_13110 [Pseudonocardia saturnea]